MPTIKSNKENERKMAANQSCAHKTSTSAPKSVAKHLLRRLKVTTTTKKPANKVSGKYFASAILTKVFLCFCISLSILKNTKKVKLFTRKIAIKNGL